MKAQLIQTTKPDDRNRAERKILQFLTNLPESYWVYRELKITPAYKERVKGFKQKQPDFVVVGPEIGALIIEVKDWNLDTNTYEWRDQYTVLKKEKNGTVEEIENPVHKAEIYLHAMSALLSDIDIYITSIVAFPRQSEQAFLNKIGNVEILRNPQTKFYLELRKTLFSESLSAHSSHPELLLTQIIKQNPRFYKPSAADLEKAKERLLPSSFRIGDFSNREAHKKRLKIISEEQQQWIFSLDQKANYLLDVAGSGKTNALISKAIHIVDTALKNNLNAPRILLTTYNNNLANNIRRLFSHKISNTEERRKYEESIRIWSIPEMMHQIVKSFDDNGMSEKGIEELKQDVQAILEMEPDKYHTFDYIFIDEIQDFDDFFLVVTKYLCKTTNFFFVGDIGQKIYERSHNLERLGLITHKIDLKKSYKMFRTPRYIAELATRFILSDIWTRRDFEQHGYNETFQYPNTLKHAAELIQTDQTRRDIVERIKILLNSGRFEEDIMVITSQKHLPEMEESLKTAGVNFRIGEAEYGGDLTLVDFMNVKGLEKEVIFVTGIEDLYDRSKSEGAFDDEDDKIKKERFSRRKIYVALTRSIEELFIYYANPNNRFIAELLNLNHDILQKRTGGL